MQQQHPFPAPIPGPQGPPASATPIADYANNKPPGLSADGEYLVLPHRLLDSMELPWQQQFGQLLQHYAQRHARAPWPQYQVRATRPTRLTDCSEEQLAEVGAFAEYTDDGALVYQGPGKVALMLVIGRTTVRHGLSPQQGSGSVHAPRLECFPVPRCQTVA